MTTPTGTTSYALQREERMSRPATFLLWLLAIASASERTAFAQCEWERTVHPDNTPQALYGESVSHRGEFAVVGSPWTQSAFVYRRSSAGWKRRAELFVVEGCCRVGEFGRAVATDGSTIVIGAPLDDDLGAGAGSAFVYEQGSSGWSLVAKLLPSDGGPGDRIGTAVVVLGDTIAVGAPGSNFAVPGSVYVFERTSGSWPSVESSKLTAGDPTPFARFGHAIDLTEGRMLVGAIGANAGYVFDADTSSWTEQAKLVASDGQIGGGVGWGVAIGENGRTVVLGSPFHGQYQGHLDSSAGAAWVFEVDDQGAWAETAELTGRDFGFLNRRAALDVDIEGDMIVLGVEAQSSISAGAIWVFNRLHDGTWRQTETRSINGMRQFVHEQTGDSVSLSGGVLLAGAPEASESADRVGAAYWIDLAPMGRSYCCPRILNSAGRIGRLWVSGSREAADDDLVLATSQLPPGNVGFFMAGNGSVGFQPQMSVGTLCVAGGSSGVKRLIPPTQSTDQLGDGFESAVGTQSVPGIGTVMSGHTWNFQAWYRDNAAGTSNFTDALSVTFD